MRLHIAHAKRKQALKLAEIREALVAAGYDSTVKQAAALGVCRATAWVLLNRDKRVGPSARLLKRILSSANLPPAARQKVEEYVDERINGVYGHRDARLFRAQMNIALPDSHRWRNSLNGAGISAND